MDQSSNLICDYHRSSYHPETIMNTNSIDTSVAYSREEAWNKLNLLCDNFTFELDNLSRDCRKLSRTLRRVTTIARRVLPEPEPIAPVNKIAIWHPEMDTHY